MSDRSVEVKDSSVGVVSTGDNNQVVVLQERDNFMNIPKPIHSKGHFMNIKPIYWIIFLVTLGITAIVSISFVFQGSSTTQTSSGNGSPNISNVSGPVTITTTETPAKPNQ